MSIKFIGIVTLAFTALCGILIALFPQRYAAFLLWKYRLIGASPAKPGPGTLLFFRILGAGAFVAASALLIFKF